jgi:multidrug resistance efflux pump
MKKTRKTNHEQKRFYLRHIVPAIVWLGTVACVVALFYQRSQRFEIVGIARGEVRQIAASSTGRIRSIPVALYQPVTVGQMLAVVDTILDNEQTLEAELKARLDTAAAEIERLSVQLIATRQQMEAAASNMEITRAENFRRFCVDVETARLKILDLQVEIASDEVTQGDSAADVKILEKLVEDKAVASYEADKARAEYENVSKKIAENGKQLQQAQEDLEQAIQRRDQFAQQQLVEPSVDHALEVIRKEIRVQEELMKGLLEQRKALQSRQAVELTSPIDGIVIPISMRENDAESQRPGEQVMRRVGEVVRAGDPILAVAQKEPTEIVAYVSEQQLGAMKESMAVELVKVRTPAQIARSQIASVSPTMELMPQRLWRNPNIPQWGRPVLIDIPPGLSLVPGEVVGIRGS